MTSTQPTPTTRGPIGFADPEDYARMRDVLNAADFSDEGILRLVGEDATQTKQTVETLYEAVDQTVVKVHDLVPKDHLIKRYHQLNSFEHFLTDNDTHVLKFFLHISKEEQLRRFKRRLDDPTVSRSNVSTTTTPFGSNFS